MTRRYAAVLYAVAALAYVGDRGTKIWAEQALAGRPPIRVIPGIFHLSYTTNTGGAFGLGGEAPVLFALASVTVVGLIVWSSFRLSRSATGIALGLVLGGALGNLTDRVLRGPGLAGPVVDFIDLRVWPVFNLADSAVVVGALLLMLLGLRRERESE